MIALLHVMRSLWESPMCGRGCERERQGELAGAKEAFGGLVFRVSLPELIFEPKFVGTINFFVGMPLTTFAWLLGLDLDCTTKASFFPQLQ